jgi:GT2 family glycosyltransferase
MSAGPVVVSVVSHAQNWLVNQLLADLAQLRSVPLQVIVTQNTADRDALDAQRGAKIVVNTQPKGFGANHNAAFSRSSAPYFCVVNPDIRLNMDPFPPLVQALQLPSAGVAGPRVSDPEGHTQDSARRFPTVPRLLGKLLAGAAGPDYPLEQGLQEVDWVAGMFMLFRSDAYREVAGFDESYFLYYEDVDICRRLQRRGRSRVFQPEASVIHDARRASRRDPRLMAIHATSALRYLCRRDK